MVKKIGLIIANAVLWMIAGVNIARIGISCALEHGGYVWLWCIPVFAAFFWMFNRTINKNSVRIKSMKEQKAPLYKFLSVKGYLIITFMMTLGITLRSLAFMPVAFFAFFYTGLGSALFLAGLKSLLFLNRE